MNDTEHLLTCLAEECAEVAKECGKGLRFGLDDQLTVDPNGPRGTEGPTNRQKIIAEVNDLLGVMRELVRCDIIPRDWEDFEAQQRKQFKLRRFMDYARRVGALQ